jgi:ATP-dependent Clp protease ATP-binding subunit ClpX
MAEMEDRLLGMIKASPAALRLTGIRTARQPDCERRLRLRTFALMGYRAIAQPSCQHVSEIADVAAAIMDRQQPGGLAILNARHLLGTMMLEELVVACGGAESGPFTKVYLAPRATEWLCGGKPSLGYLTIAKMIGINLLDEPSPSARTTPKDFVQGLRRGFPSLTPRELFDKLGRRGYVGQEQARRALCLAAYRHVLRLGRIYVEGLPAETMPRENILLRGPTGSGKSLLAKMLFEDILGLPCVIADTTTFSETGYVGEDVSSILTRLIGTHGAAIGEMGIVVLDEIDKIADPSGAEGGRSMVSRQGVQRGLLRLLEPGIVEVPTELGAHPYRCPRVSFNTANLLWVGCGAFSNFAKAVQRPVGFGAERGRRDGEGTAGASAMASYGIMHELYGRFGIDVELRPLDRPQMRDILERSVVARDRKELAAAGIGLLVEDGALEALVDRAVARGTGARGLQAEMISSLQDAAFEVYSAEGRDRLVRLYSDGGAVRWEVGTRPQDAKTRIEEVAALVIRDEDQNAAAGQ